MSLQSPLASRHVAASRRQDGFACGKGTRDEQRVYTKYIQIYKYIRIYILYILCIFMYYINIGGSIGGCADTSVISICHTGILHQAMVGSKPYKYELSCVRHWEGRPCHLWWDRNFTQAWQSAGMMQRHRRSWTWRQGTKPHRCHFMQFSDCRSTAGVNELSVQCSASENVLCLQVCVCVCVLSFLQRPFLDMLCWICAVDLTTTMAGCGRGAVQPAN